MNDISKLPSTGFPEACPGILFFKIRLSKIEYDAFVISVIEYDAFAIPEIEYDAFVIPEIERYAFVMPFLEGTLL